MQHLVLIGLMGAGKTTVGRRCAELLGRDFVDTDELVEATAGMTTAQIFEQLGEEKFRELERAAVADVCASPVPLVVACGGGAVLDAGSRRRLREASLVVWLDAPIDVLVQRVGGGEGRPLLRGDAAAALERLQVMREPSYLNAAHKTVDTDGRTVDEVAAAVIEELHAWNG